MNEQCRVSLDMPREQTKDSLTDNSSIIHRLIIRTGWTNFKSVYLRSYVLRDLLIAIQVKSIIYTHPTACIENICEITSYVITAIRLYGQQRLTSRVGPALKP